MSNNLESLYKEISSDSHAAALQAIYELGKAEVYKLLAWESEAQVESTPEQVVAAIEPASVESTPEESAPVEAPAAEPAAE